MALMMWWLELPCIIPRYLVKSDPLLKCFIKNHLQNNPNVGRVLVYKNPNYWLFSEKAVLFPKNRRENSYFGFSLASVGDMDKDGLDDFVVGAPMGGKNGAGEVYIFHGSKYFNFGNNF